MAAAPGRLDLGALEYAVVADEQGSFRQAANILGVRASAISRKIRMLEDVVGVSLFQRQSQGVKPTSAGRLILQKAVMILTDVNELLESAALSGSGTAGNLRIGIITSIAGGRVVIYLLNL